MTRKITFAFALLVLATLFTGAGFATVIPTPISFGFGSAAVTASPTGATLPALHGGAFQFFTGPYGTYSTGGGYIPVVSGPSPLTSPNSETFTFNIGTDTLTGWANFTQDVVIGNGYYFLTGYYHVTSSTAGFINTGYPTGSTAAIDMTIAPFGGKEILSGGELLPTPEPGTIALVGSGLLAAAGMLRRKL